MLLIRRWSWRKGEHWKWSLFFFHQIQNCYSVFAYLYKYICFYDQFCFLFSGKFLILVLCMFLLWYWKYNEYVCIGVLANSIGLWCSGTDLDGLKICSFIGFLWPCLVWLLRKSRKEFRTLKLMSFFYFYYFEVWFIVGVCEFENVQFIARYSLVHVNKACRFLAGDKSTPQLTW